MVRAGFHARAPFATNAERVAHRAETVAVVAQIMKRKIRDEWMSVLGDASIPACRCTPWANCPRTRTPKPPAWCATTASRIAAS